MFYIIQAVKFLSVPENIQKAIAPNSDINNGSGQFNKWY